MYMQRLTPLNFPLQVILQIHQCAFAVCAQPSESTSKTPKHICKDAFLTDVFLHVLLQIQKLEFAALSDAQRMRKQSTSNLPVQLISILKFVLQNASTRICASRAERIRKRTTSNLYTQLVSALNFVLQVILQIVSKRGCALRAERIGKPSASTLYT